MTPIADTGGSMFDVFSQYGLTGCVIAALFYSNWLLIKEIKLLSASHDERHERRNQSHAEERKEWLAAYKENTEVLRLFSQKRCGEKQDIKLTKAGAVL
jgi:hypothetical protein